MRRFYVPRDRWKGERVRLSADQAHHLVRVLRMSRGDIINVFDGEREYEARVLEADRSGAWCEIIREVSVAASRLGGTAPLHIILAQAIIKAKRMDMVIEKATELGVAQIVPFTCSRCVVRVNPQKTAHWRKIAESAAAQSERVSLPRIDAPVKIAEILNMEADLKIMLWEREDERGLEGIISRAGAPLRVILMVGPEGGFSEEEVQTARENGFLTWGLFPAVLRAETAAIAALAILEFRGQYI